MGGHRMRIRQHKFRAKSSKCYQGHYHPSKLEAEYCDLLHLQLKAGEITEIEWQPRFNMIVNGQKICAHIPDFRVTYKDGTVQVHECKGYEMPVWNIKRKLFEALYPDIDYIVIK